MVLSVLVALILSPALTATLLKAKSHEEAGPNWIERNLPWLARLWERFHTGFNRGFERMTNAYAHRVERVVEHKWRWLALFLIACVATFMLFQRLPTGFLPNEDQGTIMVQWRLPAGSPRTRTEEVQRQVENYFKTYEKANVASMFTLSGGGQGAAGQNTGQAFVTLVDWEERPGSKNTADAIVQRANGAFRNLRDAQVFTLVPGAIRGLGSSSGFTMEFQNRSGMSRTEFQKARDELLAKATADDRLTNVRLSDLPDVATLKINSNTRALTTYGLTAANANSTLQTAWGGTYVNDFIDKGRVKRVYVQGDAQFRSRPEDLSNWFVRGTSGQMVPFSAFSTISWSTAPSTSSRFNGLQAYEFSGSPSAGVSSGTAMDVMEELASQVPGTAVAWAGSSYQERLSSGQAPLLYALSLLVVFLCLAALYESWSIPIAVILVIPLGLLGAILAVTLRGLENDVYLQIGLLTTMGLAAKNAILMIEFAEQAERQGKRVIEAALEAARIRLRPILMTSFAFIFGVVPLAVASGAGANSRIAIGTAVVGGMLTATLLAIFFIPLFFVLVRRGVRDGIAAVRQHLQQRRERKGDTA
ncbi:hydrophobe/amphiphile efflux-1 (HAE1) family protein [Novosphingobium sp. ST904]|nr:hydrophobe/amphiphile efflux-1 (HAE1) family protein [Novosphingobium sp. ST904]